MRQRLSEWIKENTSDTSRENGLKNLIDEISPLALTADKERDLLYVSQRDSATILKVSLIFTGAQLKGVVEPFITMTRKACNTGLAYSKESCDLYVADSQDDAGIYMIDTAVENGEPTYVKLVDNNTTTCSRAYSLTVVHSGDVYFTDVDARKIGRLCDGNAAEYVIGSGEETPIDGCEKTASFVQPTGLCTEGDSLFVTDTGSGALKLISPNATMANFLQQVSFSRNSFILRVNFYRNSSYGRCYTLLRSSHKQGKDQCRRKSNSGRTSWRTLFKDCR